MTEITLEYLHDAGHYIAADNVDFARSELDTKQAAIVALAWLKVADEFDYESWLPGAIREYTYPGFHNDLLADLGNDMVPYVDTLVEKLEAYLADCSLDD